MNPKKCPKCGESNPPEAVMCWACYTPLSGSAGSGPSSQSTPAHAAESEKKAIPPWQLGLVAVGEVGEQFNPELHEAYGQDATDDKTKDDVVTAVLEKGWKQGERVIRPAKVRVAHYQ